MGCPTLQTVTDTHVDEDWTGVTSDRGVWEALEAEFARQVFDRQVRPLDVPRHRHHVQMWPAQATHGEKRELDL